MIPFSRCSLRPRPAPLLALALALASPLAAQNHNLDLVPAPDITSTTDPAARRSPYIKVGASFGDASVPDIVRRGVTNPIFARVRVNGVDDIAVPSGAVAIRFHYRSAALGETPPALAAPGAGWNLIGSLPVSWGSTPPPLPPPGRPIGTIWPDPMVYPAVPANHIDWAAPAAGDFFHLRAEAVYPAGITDIHPSDNVAISLYESILGIRDVDLVIVHDVSGSMLSFQYAGSSYLDQAKARANAFILSMNESHRLAVVAFGGCLAGDVSNIWGPSLQLATFGNKVAATTNITNNVTVPNLGCATPMGAGIQRAVDILTSVPPDPTRKRAILLLTDGYENSGSPLICSGSDPTGPCIGSSLLAQLQANHIRVFSIALGTSAWTECLECITVPTGGQWYAPAGPGIDLAQVYLDMQQTYSADDLYRADQGVTGGGDDSYTTRFEGVDDILYFILQSDDLNAKIDLELQPPGGSWQSPDAVAHASVRRDRGYVVARIENPAAGTWGYRVVGEARRNYLAAVRSDRVGVRLALDVKTDGKVGTPIVIRALVTDQGKPIQAPGLTATVQVPAGSSLDSRLRQQARTLLQRGTRPFDPAQTQSSDLSPRAAFVQSISNGQQQTLAQTRIIKVPLQQEADGSYSGVLSQPTEIAGEYKITVTYHSAGADRVQTTSVRLAPADLDARKSFAELVSLAGRSADDRQWFARFYPTDQYGNAITDRSLLNDLRFSVRGGELNSTPGIAFDSAVEQPLRVSAGQRPVLDSVQLRGQDVRVERPLKWYQKLFCWILNCFKHK